MPEKEEAEQEVPVKPVIAKKVDVDFDDLFDSLNEPSKPNVVVNA